MIRCCGRRFSIGFAEGRSMFAEPVMNLFCDGMKISNVSPSLTISKMFVPTTGACPITRMLEGLAARMNPVI